MSELIPIDNGTIPPLSCIERWYAAVTVCDEAPDGQAAAYVLQMLGLIEADPQLGRYVPVGRDGEGESWYPPSPFIQPYVKMLTVAMP